MGVTAQRDPLADDEREDPRRHVKHCAQHGDYSEAVDECPRCRMGEGAHAAKREVERVLSAPKEEVPMAVKCPKCPKKFQGENAWWERHVAECTGEAPAKAARKKAPGPRASEPAIATTTESLIALLRHERAACADRLAKLDAAIEALA